MAGKTQKKGNKAGFLFWLIFAVIIVIAFLIARGKISSVLSETGFFKEVLGETPEFIDGVISKKDDAKDTVIDIVTQKEEAAPVDLNSVDKIPETAVQPSVQTPSESAAKPEKTQKESDLTLAKPDKKETQQTAAQNTGEKTTMLLYFVMIEGDGSVVRKEISREIDKTQTPLTTALKALLQGPSIGELEKGTMSLIPEGTKLLSASITDKTAFLNFSEEFQYNKYGVEGYLGQLMQIVYTATSFSSIESVQFLINGQKESYLGGEGVWIGSPLPRSTFK